MEVKQLKNYTVTCSDCGSELSFENSDMFYQPHEVFNRKGFTENIVKWWFIKCPVCGKEIHVRYEKEFCDKVKFRYHDLEKSEKEDKMTTLDDINTSIKNLTSKINTVLDVLLESVEVSEERKIKIEAEKTALAIREMTESFKDSEGYQKWLEEVEELAAKKQECKENGIEGYQGPESEEEYTLGTEKDPEIYNDKDLFREIPDPFHERSNKGYILTDTYLKYWDKWGKWASEPLVSFIKKNTKAGDKVLLVGFPKIEELSSVFEGLLDREINLLTDNPSLKEDALKMAGCFSLGPKKILDVSNIYLEASSVLTVSDLKMHFADFDSLYNLVIRYKDF